MEERIVDFTDFIVKIGKEEIVLFKKLIDPLGNDYVTKEAAYALIDNPKTYRSNDHSFSKNLVLELVKLKEENNNLKFHIKLEGNLKWD